MPCAGPLPNAFFFGVLAGEVPFDYLQTNLLREPEPRTIHPIMQDLIAIHVAEEARHISFAHEYLHRRVPRLTRFSRFWLSLYVPVVMRMLGQAMVVPSRRFFRQFGDRHLGCFGDRGLGRRSRPGHTHLASISLNWRLMA